MNEIYFERILKAFDFEKVESTSETSIPFYIFHNIAIYYDNGAIFKGKVPLEVLDKFADEEGVKVESPLTKIDNYLPILAKANDELEEKLVELSDIVADCIVKVQENNYISEIQITDKRCFIDFLLEIEKYYSKKQGLDYDEEKVKINLIDDSLKEVFGSISKEDWIRNNSSFVKEKNNNLQEKFTFSSLEQRLKEAIDNFDKAVNIFNNENIKSIADIPDSIKIDYYPIDKDKKCYFKISVDDVLKKIELFYDRSANYLSYSFVINFDESPKFSVDHTFSNLEDELKEKIVILDKDCNLASSFSLEKFTVWTDGNKSDMTVNDIYIIIDELEKATMLIQEKVLNDMTQEEPRKKI